MMKFDNTIILGDDDLLYGALIKDEKSVFDFNISQQDVNKSTNIIYINKAGVIQIFKKKYGKRTS